MVVMYIHTYLVLIIDFFLGTKLAVKRDIIGPMICNWQDETVFEPMIYVFKMENCNMARIIENNNQEIILIYIYLYILIYKFRYRYINLMSEGS